MSQNRNARIWFAKRALRAKNGLSSQSNLGFKQTLADEYGNSFQVASDSAGTFEGVKAELARTCNLTSIAGPCDNPDNLVYRGSDDQLCGYVQPDQDEPEAVSPTIQSKLKPASSSNNILVKLGTNAARLAAVSLASDPVPDQNSVASLDYCISGSAPAGMWNTTVACGRKVVNDFCNRPPVSDDIPGWEAGAIIGGILGGVGALMLLMCCCARRNRSDSNYQSLPDNTAPSRRPQ